MTEKDIENTLNQIRLITIMHPQFNNTYEGIRGLVKQSQRSGCPTGGSVTAPSGTGKSHLISVIKREYIQNSDLIDSSSAVIAISASASPNIGSIIDRMLQELGHPPGVRATRLQDLRLSILIKALVDRNVQLIIIDEFQHLFRGRRDSSANEITDLLKEITDKTRIPIFVFGTDELGDLSQIDVQFASRLPARFQIRPFVRGAEWQAFLRAFHTTCTCIDLSIISSVEAKIHLTTNGSPRALKFLLIAAATVAMNEGRTTVEISDLRNGFSHIFGTAGSNNNPFN